MYRLKPKIDKYQGLEDNNYKKMIITGEALMWYGQGGQFIWCKIVQSMTQNTKTNCHLLEDMSSERDTLQWRCHKNILIAI